MASKVVNQNDIAKIVKSSTEASKIILTCISDLVSSKQIYMRPSTLNNIEKFQALYGKIISDKDGVISCINSLYVSMQTTANILITGKVKPHKLFSQFKEYMTHMEDMFNDMIEVTRKLENRKVDAKVLKPVTLFVETLNKTFKSISDTKINLKTLFKIQFMKYALKSLKHMMKYVIKSISDKDMKKLEETSKYFEYMNNIFTYLQNMDKNRLKTKQVKRIKTSLVKVNKIIEFISDEYVKEDSIKRTTQKLNLTVDATKEISELFKIINLIKIGIKTFIKFKLIYKGFNEINKILERLKDIKVEKTIINQLKLIQKVFKHIDDIFRPISKHMFIYMMSLISISLLNIDLKKLEKSIKLMNKLSVTDNTLKRVRKIKSVIKVANKIFFKLSLNIIIYAINLIAISLFIVNIKLLNKSLKSINSLKLKAKTLHKVNEIKKVIKAVNSIFKSFALGFMIYMIAIPAMFAFNISLKILDKTLLKIKNLGKGQINNGLKRKTKNISISIGSIVKVMMLIVLAMPIFAMFSIAALIFIASLKMLKKVIKSIKRVARSCKMKTAVKVGVLSSVVFNITMLMSVLVLMSPVALMFILVSVVWMISLLALWILIKIISKVGRSCMKPKVILGMTAILIILGELLLIALELALIILISGFIVKNVKILLQFFLVLVVVTIVIGIIGWLISKFTSILIGAIIGFALLGIIVGIILIIGLLLLAITKLKIDKEKVKAAVKNILECVISIIEAIFEASQIENNQKSDSFFGKIFSAIMGTASVLVKAILGIVILVAAFVAIFIILLIASLLSLLGMIKLKKDRILQNVRIVFATAHAVIDACFEPVNDPKEHESPGWFKCILQGVGDIIKLILAVGKLALTLVAVLIILLIATILLLLQKVKLNPGKIKQNVGIILDTARFVWSLLFNPEKNPEDHKSPGFWGTVIGILGDFGDLIRMILNVGKLVLTVLAVLLIRLIATCLKLFENLELNPEQIKSNVYSIIDTAYCVWSCLFAPEKNPEEHESPGFWGTVIGILGDFGDLIRMILTVGKLVLTIIAILLLKLMVTTLKTLEDLQLDVDTIKSNVKTIIDCGAEVWRQLFAPENNPDNHESRGWFMSVLSFFGVPVEILEAILAIGKLVLTMIALKMLVFMCDSLKTLEDLQLDADTIKSNVKTVIDCGAEVWRQLFAPENNPDNHESHGWFMSVLSFFGVPVEIIEAILAIAKLALTMVALKMLIFMCDSLKTLENITLDVDTIKTNVKNIVDCGAEVWRQLFAPENNPEDHESKSWFGAILSFFGVPTDIIEGILKIGKLVLTITALKLLIYMCDSLKTLEKITLDAPTIKKNVGKVVDCGAEVWRQLYAPQNNPEEHKSKSWFGAILSFFGVPTDIMEGIMKIGKLVLTISALKMLVYMCDSLKTLEKITLDAATIKTNVKDVIDCGAEVWRQLYAPQNNPEPHKSQSWSSKILKFLGYPVEMIEATTSIARISLTITALKLILFMVIQLKMLEKITLDAKSIKKNVKDVIDCGAEVWRNVYKEENNPQPHTSSNWVSGVLKFLGYPVEMVEATTSIAKMSLTITALKLILFTTAQLKILEGLTLDADTIKSNVKKVIECGAEIWRELFAEENNPQPHESYSWTSKVLKFFNYPTDMIEATTSIAKMSLSVAAAKLLNYLAVQLRLLQNVNLDAGLIKKNVKNIIDCGAEVWRELFAPENNPQPQKSESWMSDVLGFFGYPTEMVEATTSIAKMSLTIVATKLIYYMSFQLNLLQKASIDSTTIKRNVNDILNTASSIYNMINKEISKPVPVGHSFKSLLYAIAPGMFRNSIDGISQFEYISQMMCAVGSVLSLGMILNKLNDINIGNSEQNANNICDICEGIFNRISGGFVKLQQTSYAIRLIKELVNTMNSLGSWSAHSASKTAQTFTGFVKQIDDVDLEKLREMKGTLQYMAEFSNSINGDFRELADTLNEKIAPLIEQLKDAINDVKGTIIDEGVTNRNVTIDAATGTLSQDNATDEQLSGQVHKNLGNAVLQEIYDLMLGVNGYRGVKTC